VSPPMSYMPHNIKLYDQVCEHLLLWFCPVNEKTACFWHASPSIRGESSWVRESQLLQGSSGSVRYLHVCPSMFTRASKVTITRGWRPLRTRIITLASMLIIVHVDVSFYKLVITAPIKMDIWTRVCMYLCIYYIYTLRGF
jgi:hypothetical protein